MVYTGEMKNGVVVFDGNEAPPDGAKVQVTVRGPAAAADVPPDVRELRQTLLKYAGRMKGLPRDLAQNLDYYLYGVPKRLDE